MKTCGSIVVRDPPLPIRFDWYYCENAPDRGVVESTEIVRDASEDGEPLKLRLVWSAKMKVELERHIAEHRRLLRQRKLGNEWVGGRPEREVEPPPGPDMYGGTVHRYNGLVMPRCRGLPMRCLLCGGWMRSKPAHGLK